MSYAMMGMGMGMGSALGAYDPVAAPVFDGCTMNLTTGRTKWPAQWACNRANFLAALDANRSMMPSNATQTAINLHLMDFFNDVIAGKIPGPAGFPSTKDMPKPPEPPKIEPKVEPNIQPPEGPRLSTSLVAPNLVTAPSSTMKYVIIGGGALAVIGLVLATRKRG